MVKTSFVSDEEAKRKRDVERISQPFFKTYCSLFNFDFTGSYFFQIFLSRKYQQLLYLFSHSKISCKYQRFSILFICFSGCCSSGNLFWRAVGRQVRKKICHLVFHPWCGAIHSVDAFCKSVLDGSFECDYRFYYFFGISSNCGVCTGINAGKNWYGVRIILWFFFRDGWPCCSLVGASC